jgi:fructose-1,6-bisphosphatase II / sedoheptulose-1,7-bisphosphatase
MTGSKRHKKAIAALDKGGTTPYRPKPDSGTTRGKIMVQASSILDRVLVLEMVRVTEAAAIAAARLVGRGDEKAADAAAVEAMRLAFNDLYMDGTVVIGEGERDEAPMLYIGEKVGNAIGTGPKIDIALDPLEGTTITAKAGPNALAVLAISEEGGLLNAPDVYMEKLAVGPGYPEGIIDLNKSVKENVEAVAAHKGVEPGDIIVCVLDRPRHEKLIAELRGIGCGIMLIPDGDVAGVIATTNPETTIDIYMGSGGAPEGVLACAALRCVGGQFKGRLLFRNEDEKQRAYKWGIEDLDKVYDLKELAKGDCIFAATGVTDGSLLAGVKRLPGDKLTTESVVMRASTGTVRWVKGEHRLGVKDN